MSIKKEQIVGLCVALVGLFLLGIGIMFESALAFYSGAALTILGGIIINPFDLL